MQLVMWPLKAQKKLGNVIMNSSVIFSVLFLVKHIWCLLWKYCIITYQFVHLSSWKCSVINRLSTHLSKIDIISCKSSLKLETIKMAQKNPQFWYWHHSVAPCPYSVLGFITCLKLIKCHKSYCMPLSRVDNKICVWF